MVGFFPLNSHEMPRKHDEMKEEDFQELSNRLFTRPSAPDPTRRAATGRASGTIQSRGKTVRTGGNTLIRQAISCDICGSEKKLTNHWFVAHEQGGELRLTGWSSRNRLRPGSKHLCGQICLHKLVDEYMARTIAVRVQASSAEEVGVPHQALATDASLTSKPATAHTAPENFESSARLLTSPEPVFSKPFPIRASAELVSMPGRQPIEELAVPSEAPRYTSRNWRAEAWNREREREMGSVERHPNTNVRRRSGL
jgi:hypothetical protein